MIRLIERLLSWRGSAPPPGFLDPAALKAPELIGDLSDAPPCECEGAMEALCDWRRCCEDKTET